MRVRAAEDVNDFTVAPDGCTVAMPTDAGDVEVLSTTDLSPLVNLKGGHSNIAGCARFRGDGSEPQLQSATVFKLF